MIARYASRQMPLCSIIRKYKFFGVKPLNHKDAMQHTKEHVKHREHKDEQRTQRHFLPLCVLRVRKAALCLCVSKRLFKKGREAFFLWRSIIEILFVLKKV
ncbi:hypothetical protein PIPA1_06860 [Pelosinus sp. IPA-1]|nr:hypothetical protein PIPA1_06860 [Pelosinus sp. IPA-1]